MALIFALEPQKSLGPVAFGTNRSVVRQSFSEQPHCFRRVPDSPLCDAFYQSTLFVYYNSAGLVEAVEAAQPNSITIYGDDLMRRSQRSLRLQLLAQGFNVVTDSEGVTSSDAGMSAWFPDPLATEPTSILAAQSGYFQ